MENRISIVLPKEAEAAFLAKINEAMELVKPYIVTVSDDDKSMLLKLGDKFTPFVKKVEDYTVTDAEFVPNFLDTVEFTKDTTSLFQYDGLISAIDKLQLVLEDTRSLLANDAFSAALLYYKFVKMAADTGNSKAKVIYEDLSKWFPGRTVSKKASS
jgi:hypothetical protein